MITLKERYKLIEGKSKLGLLLMFFCFFPSVIFAQDSLLQKRISAEFHDILIDSALDSISRKYDCFFTYNAELFSQKEKISVSATNEELIWVLRKIIPDTTLGFHVVNKHIIIIPAEYDTTKPITPSTIPYISYRKISGQITDSHSALPYANIGIRGKQVGTISNQNGEFSLTLSSSNQKDTLVVSYVGYKNFEIPIVQLKENEVSIILQEDFISLQEVVIRNNDPVSLIKASLNKIPSNYPQKPANLTSFYRESVLKNNKYMIYLESILDIYKNPYSGEAITDRVKVFKSRKIYDVSRLDTISFRLKGGIEGCLLLDIVRHQPEFLHPELMDFYSYRLVDISTYDNNSVYIIEFKPKPNMELPLLEGKLIMDTKSLAIIRAEFSYNESRVAELSDRFVSKGNAKTKVKPQQIEYLVNYRKINGKYYLNHALGNLKFKVKNKKKLFSTTFTTSFEMATNQCDTLNVRKFKFRETIQPTTVLSNERLAYDPNFWGNQNFIQPEENIQEALKRINHRMQQVAMEESIEK